MKTFNLLMLLSLIGLASCAGQKSSTKLEITHGFAMSNPTYAGGLIVSGVNIDTQEKFTQGLVGSTTVSYNLTAGTWNFTAIGWDGGTPEKLYGGKPFCAFSQNVISGTSASVTLQMSESLCGFSLFAGNLPDTSVTPNTIRKLKYIVPCNSLFASIPNPSTVMNTVVVSDSTPLTYCDALGFDMKANVQSMKVHAYSKAPDQSIPTLTMHSDCISQSGSGNYIEPSGSTPTNPYMSNALRLPARSVPFAISVYSDSNCSSDRLVTRFDFKEGLETKSPDHDHVLVSNFTSLSDHKLFIAGNDMKRGFSMFAHILPFFKRQSSGNPFPMTNSGLTTGTRYFTVDSQPFKIKLEEDFCTPTGGNFNVASALCNAANELEVTPSGNGYGYVNYNNKQYGFYSSSVADSLTYVVQKNLYTLLGNSQSVMQDEYDHFFLGDGYHDDERRYGYLSRVRSILSANGAGGVVSRDMNKTFSQQCLDLAEDKEVSVFDYEDMRFKRFRVKISSNSLRTSTPYTCDNSSYDSDCSFSYDKQMDIWEYDQSTILPSMTFGFDCDDFKGTFESIRVNAIGGLKKTKRDIVNWNTNTDSLWAFQRFEVLNWEKIELNAVVQSDKRNLSRMQKNGSNEYVTRTTGFESKRNGSSYDEIFNRVAQQSSGNFICFAHTSSNPMTLQGVPYQNAFYLTSDSPLVAYRTTPPGSEISSLSNKLDITSAFPQTRTDQSCNFDPVASVNNGHLINGSFEMRPALLNDEFKSQFTLISP